MRSLIWIARFSHVAILAALSWPIFSAPERFIDVSQRAYPEWVSSGDLFVISEVNPLPRLLMPGGGSSGFLLQAWVAALWLFAGLSLARPFKAAILLAWVFWLCLVDFHGALLDVSLGFLGWIALSGSWIHPSDENFASKQHVYRPVVWLVFGLAYTVSGWMKWSLGPSWQSGEALSFIFQNDLFLREGASRLAWLPSWLLRTMSWGTLAAETAALPMVLLGLIPGFGWMRWLSWLLLTLLQVGLALLLDLGWLSFGMLSVHLWVLAFGLSGATHESVDA